MLSSRLAFDDWGDPLCQFELEEERSATIGYSTPQLTWINQGTVHHHAGRGNRALH